ncbi:MAG: putative solute-binding protein [Myxococcota bacterium]
MLRTALLIVLALLPTAALAQAPAAPIDRVLCVYDPSGTQGDIYKFAERYQAAALEWGVRFQLKPNTNEGVTTADFKAGQCQAALVSGLRARSFVKATGTIEALGALQTYDHLKRAVKILSSAKAVSYVKDGVYETTAILPAGAVYLLLRNKDNASMAKLAGKRVATLTNDDAARTMVDTVGASVVSAEMGTFAGIFNNGRADVAYAPATALKPLELHKGMGSGGGIVKYALAQLTFQVLVKSADFPAEFGGKSRTWGADRFAEGLAMSLKAERAVPGGQWITVSPEDKAIYDTKLRDVRVKLRNKGVYHGGILKLMKRIRCESDKAAAECTDSAE